jgi:hypothetical protein
VHLPHARLWPHVRFSTFRVLASVYGIESQLEWLYRADAIPVGETDFSSDISFLRDIYCVIRMRLSDRHIRIGSLISCLVEANPKATNSASLYLGHGEMTNKEYMDELEARMIAKILNMEDELKPVLNAAKAPDQSRPLDELLYCDSSGEFVSRLSFLMALHLREYHNGQRWKTLVGENGMSALGVHGASHSSSARKTCGHTDICTVMIASDIISSI